MGFERIVPGTKEWDAYHGNHFARYLFAIEMLRPRRPETILDAACGVGYGTKHLAETLGATVVGADRSPDALAIANERFAHRTATFLQDDCHTLEAAAKHGPFDAVVSMETFEHLPKPMEFLAAVRRVLKPGGWFIVSTPNGEVFANAGEWEFHEREYTAGELVSMLETASFQDVRLFGQELTERGKDRAELRAELARLAQNPFMRLGRFFQRTLRGRRTETAVLPERPEDFQIVRLDASLEANQAAKTSEVLVCVATR
jgi:ubiquinone/menaquinone biosynthesis C-methylase UbiE